MHKTEQVKWSVRTIQGLILLLRFSGGHERRQHGERAMCLGRTEGSPFTVIKESHNRVVLCQWTCGLSTKNSGWLIKDEINNHYLTMSDEPTILTSSFHLLLRICYLSSQIFAIKWIFVTIFHTPDKENIHILIHIHPFIYVYLIHTLSSA